MYFHEAYRKMSSEKKCMEVEGRKFILGRNDALMEWDNHIDQFLVFKSFQSSLPIFAYDIWNETEMPKEILE